jgi:glycosyltransferase involved in cell wall biosynthesis
MDNIFPLVSVVMAVYNGEETVSDAIESMQRQTWQDWEFIVIDDASTDKTNEVLQRKSSHDTRIRVFRNKTSKGLAASLNVGWKLARGSLIARMDADDISLPTRLQKQVDFLKQNNDVTVLGTGILVKNKEGEIVGQVSRPSSHAELRNQILYKVPFFHPTVMMRKKFLEDSGGYNEKFLRAQDYELWSRSIDKACYANLLEPLLQYTATEKQTFKSIFWGAYAIYRAATLHGAWIQRLFCPVRFFASSIASCSGVRSISLKRAALQDQKASKFKTM